MGKALQEFYLDWANNYLTLEQFAEDHGLSPETAGQLIDIGRSLHNAENDAKPLFVTI